MLDMLPMLSNIMHKFSYSYFLKAMLWINVDVAKYVAGQNTSCATCRLKREDMEFVAITWFVGEKLR